MNVVARLGAQTARVAEKVIPDPFVIAVLLAAAVFGLGLALSDATITTLSVAFSTGALATPLLAFAFKMALVLVTGHALADAPVVQRALSGVASLPKTSAQAAVLVALTSMILGLLNWGLGLVGGAFLAREVARVFLRRTTPLNYPLVGAAGYMGMLVWHGGFSGSAPLTVAKESAMGAPIPIDESLLSTMNLGVAAVLLVVIPVLFFALGAGASPQGTPSLPPSDRSALTVGTGVVGWLESRGLVIFLLSSPLLIALIYGVRTQGTSAISLEFVILAFLVLGLVAHQNPQSYARSFSDGARGTAGILLQFPIYFGILAMAKESQILVAAATATNGLIGDFFGLAPSKAAPVLTFVAAAGINMVVPSGGGQWVLQAPLIADACATFKLSRGAMVMAFSYGDQLTNLLQPFWALPLLSITGIKARELLGYTLVAMVVATPVFVGALLYFGAGGG